jgi:hypothetical protein
MLGSPLRELWLDFQVRAVSALVFWLIVKGRYKIPGSDRRSQPRAAAHTGRTGHALRLYISA